MTADESGLPDYFYAKLVNWSAERGQNSSMLARQARNLVLTLGVRTVARGACGDIGFGKSFLVDALAQRTH